MTIPFSQVGPQPNQTRTLDNRAHTASIKDAPTTPPSDFDLAVLNHSREMYFLPGLDRLAATLASKAESPIKVRMEARGQFLEYTVDGKHPEAPIQASLNGSPFEMVSKHNPDNSWDMDADTTGGTISGTVTQEPKGTHWSGLITAPGDQARFCTERIAIDDKGVAVSGNFACSRMMENFTQTEEGLQIEGLMGDYKVSGLLSQGPAGTLVNELDLGDIHFHQTFTPLSDDPKAALTLGLLSASKS